MNIACLKDLPIEIDMGIEDKGYTPDYSKFGNMTEEYDSRRIALVIDGYQVGGISDGGKLFVEMVLAPRRLNQKMVDVLEASEKDEE